MAQDLPVKSLKKALDILDLLLFQAGEAGLALSAIAQAQGLPANTAHHLLKTMVACGYAEQAPSGRYRAGGKWRQAGRLRHLLAGEAAARRLGELARRLGESCVLAALANGDRLVLARAEGGQAVQVAPGSVETGLLYASPTGRVLVAWAEPAERQAILDRHGPPGKRWDGLRDAAALERAAKRLRAAGACRILTKELAAVAVPVLGADGQLLGALGAYAPRFRCPPRRLAAMIRDLRKTAAAMARM